MARQARGERHQAADGARGTAARGGGVRVSHEQAVGAGAAAARAGQAVRRLHLRAVRRHRRAGAASGRCEQFRLRAHLHQSARPQFACKQRPSLGEADGSRLDRLLRRLLLFARRRKLRHHHRRERLHEPRPRRLPPERGRQRLLRATGLAGRPFRLCAGRRARAALPRRHQARHLRRLPAKHPLPTQARRAARLDGAKRSRCRAAALRRLRDLPPHAPARQARCGRRQAVRRVRHPLLRGQAGLRRGPRRAAADEAAADDGDGVPA
mmetsp:Transcript_27220/g.86661  ORF Transcript_27220/g.86661 Transcript_27220/m.86661 type:complete len:267 (+) Transcript_27220:455-1255(+)